MGILDFLYPKRCAGCKKAGAYFCASCIKAAELHFPQVCPVCEKASVRGAAHASCQKPFTPDALLAIWSYQGAPRLLISKLKYKYVSDLALALALPAAAVVKSWPQEEKFTFVPIPLYWMRKNWRGFNHTEEVARIIGQTLGWEVKNLLSRRKKARPQVGLSRKERKDNIRGVFVAQKSKETRNDNILLFDDVWTSGSTMKEAARVLKQSGFKKVWCLTLAR